MNPAINASVIVPMHNAHDHIERMLRCLQAQTHPSFEVLFVDDASTDDTVELAQSLFAGDERFHLVEQPYQAGPGAARNAGITQAQGDYLFFFDVDDEVSPMALEHAFARARETAADIVIFQMDHFDVRDNIRRPSPDAWDATAYPDVFNPADFADNLFGSFRNWPVDKAFKRTFIEQHQLRFPHLYRTEDLAFTCAALAQAQRIALLNEVLYTYRIGSAAASTQNRDVAPLDFLESARVLKSTLEQASVMDTYRTTYTQWVGLACCVNVLELDNFQAFKQAYCALHEGGLADIALDANRRRQAGIPSDTTVAAGTITNADIDDMLTTIETCDVDEGTFKLLSIQRELEQRHWDFLLNEVRDSHSFKLGNAMLAPLRLFRKDASNKVE